jgi:hypothetical protein
MSKSVEYKKHSPLKHVWMRRAKAANDLKAIADMCRNFVDQVHTDDYDADEFAFLKAMERYKREYRRPYPTWREVLAVVKSLWNLQRK